MPGIRADIHQAAQRQGASLPAGAEDRLAAYLGLLLACAARLNLTAARQADEAVAVLLEPSLAVAHAWPGRFAPGCVLDLGSGNGFPGVVAAALWPTARVWLVERRAKKAHAIAECLAGAGIDNARALACDARDLGRLQPALAGAVDLVTVRAVGALAPTTRVAAPLLSPGGRVAHWKAADLGDEERRAGLRAARALRLVVLPELASATGRGRLVLYARPGVRS